MALCYIIFFIFIRGKIEKKNLNDWTEKRRERGRKRKKKKKKALCNVDIIKNFFS